MVFMFPSRDPEKDGLAMELISTGTRKLFKLYQVQLKLEMGRNFFGIPKGRLKSVFENFSENTNYNV